MKIFKILILTVAVFSVLSCSNEVVDNQSSDPLFKTVPDINRCIAGVISDVEKNKVVRYLNEIRTKHGLENVEYDTHRDDYAQFAALICASKANIRNQPVADDDCYDLKGRTGWSIGNNSIWLSAVNKWPLSEAHITDYMIEKGMNSETLNTDTTLFRRRRILDPFLKQVSFGRVIGTPKDGDYKYISVAVLIAKNGTEQDLSEKEVPQFIAFPHNAYDAKLFDPDMYLSFSVFFDKLTKANNSKVDFSDATIEVTANSQLLTLKNISFDNHNEGLPNNLQWKVAGLTKNITYHVKISNVIVNEDEENPREYTYSFSIK